MVWPFAQPDDGSVWQHGQAPPLFFSQKARMTARLSAPLFSIDSLLQSPLSNHREFCKELSERVYEIFLKCPVPERNRKILHFDGKWSPWPALQSEFQKFRLEVANLEKLSQKRLCPEQVQRGIVYQFSDRTLEISLEDFLRDNPGKTEADFMALKAVSDEIYLEQARLETAQGNKTFSMTGLEDAIAHPAPSLDDSFIMSDDRRRVKLAVDKLFRCGRLTVKQKERFVRHFFAGVSLRKIASDEGVHFTSVDESIRRAVDKLRTYFNEVK